MKPGQVMLMRPGCKECEAFAVEVTAAGSHMGELDALLLRCHTALLVAFDTCAMGSHRQEMFGELIRELATELRLEERLKWTDNAPAVLYGQEPD